MKQFAALFVSVTMLFLPSCGEVGNRLTVVNNSKIRADKVTVTVCGKDVVFENVAAGSRQSRHFAVTSDSGFVVSAQMADGTTISHKFGYVTGGAGANGNHAEIEITPDNSLKGRQL